MRVAPATQPESRVLSNQQGRPPRLTGANAVPPTQRNPEDDIVTRNGYSSSSRTPDLPSQPPSLQNARVKLSSTNKEILSSNRRAWGTMSTQNTDDDYRQNRDDHFREQVSVCGQLEDGR